MRKIPLKVAKSLESRKQHKAFRTLGRSGELLDFSSNDYLGFSASHDIFRQTREILGRHELMANGATGSRLLSGNHQLYGVLEDYLAKFHQVRAALVFNSGYDANVGFFSSVPKRGDLIFYDELVHASIRDGISMSHARALKFRHNDLEDLNHLAERNVRKDSNAEIFIVTESVFSMDGDSPDLKSLAAFACRRGYFLVVDEAHAVGVCGATGEGLVQELEIEDEVFARIITFGKAMGAHGAGILGSTELRDYLINFARSFIYTTALPPHSVGTILAAYRHLENNPELDKLWKNIEFFRNEVKNHQLQSFFIGSNSAIHCCIIPGNEKVKEIGEKLREEGFDVKPILSPTVPVGAERLRFCLHSFNSQGEITRILTLLSIFVK